MTNRSPTAAAPDVTVSEMSSHSSDDVEQSLYAKREKIYPREVHGLFAKLRTAGVVGLLGLYYIVPWLQWDERQAVLFDLPERKFYILNMVFWPQDFFYLALLLIVAALGLFFVTALAGRVWCGYACPQTVWTEVFLWVERKVEGSRPQQMKLDKQPNSFRKIRIKITKHFIWIVLSIFTGLTFVGYFSPLRELTANFFTFNNGPWENFWIYFYALATYGNAGWLREQVCLYMCPYARFQSAMFDSDTMVISFDKSRGLPKGPRKKTVDKTEVGLGDCIDCTICVQVCPTGIDIRDGLQYQCIGCAACIDACDDVMDKMGYSHGLIRYTTENMLLGDHVHVVRPRMIVYALILISITLGAFYSILTRTPIGIDVIRDRNSLYRETDDGLIENVYIVKLLNMDKQDHIYGLTVAGIPELILKKDTAEIVVKSGEVIELPVRVQVDAYNLKQRSNEIKFTLNAIGYDKLTVVEDARFLGPKFR
ncbi:Type cbb3 cytochrome oxidase biogenesis protein CcoG, involved in Cu oxidation [hydrothermal vent metagenome]|uniref:Type cbb3 cytochrome oxidase biogenesis protein CcoG, involved in Cu oxidation n=1 Tax=hydrothermal vent metagenome TaxID=652676 RepID=A0A3B0WH17_9ZZZZ